MLIRENRNNLERSMYPRRQLQCQLSQHRTNAGRKYGVLPFGEKNLSVAVAYIHNQKEHLAKGALIEAMEKTDEP